MQHLIKAVNKLSIMKLDAQVQLPHETTNFKIFTFYTIFWPSQVFLKYGTKTNKVLLS